MECRPKVFIPAYHFRMKNPLLITFGNNVRTRRLALRISQEELAERADLHRTYVGGIERGERNVAVLNIVALAKALECPPEQLFKGVEKR